MGNSYIKKQSWFLVLIFQMLSFGIYGIFWIKNIRADAKKKGKEHKINGTLFNIYIIFVILGFISAFIGYWITFSLLPNSINYLNNPELLTENPMPNLKEDLKSLKKWEQYISLLNITQNFSWILLIILAFQCKKYLKETYDINTNGFFTFFFTILQLQSRINEEYDKIENYNSSTPNNLQEPISVNEQRAKDYIAQYKSQFSKDSIKTGLKNAGINENEIEIYLNKYF